MKFYLVRHGQTDDNVAEIIQGHKNTSLNEMGRIHAFETGSFLKKRGVHFDGLFYSPLKRAEESAMIINSILKIENAKVIPDLIERDFGILEGLNVSNSFSVSCPENAMGYEKDEVLFERVFNCLTSLTSAGENILIVSHSHTLISFLHHYNETFDFFFGLPNLAIVVVEYTGIFQIVEIIYP